MTQMGIFQIVFYLIILLLLVKPLGWYIARIYENKSHGFFERFIYRLCGIQSDKEMNWKEYLSAMLLFNFLGLILIYFIQRLQAYFPLNLENFPSLSEPLAFNTATSFVTNTNWQSYSAEKTISYFTQMLGLTVQNFLSAASGMAILMALIRGLIRQEGKGLGNYWVDLIRGTLYLFLPLAFVFAIILGSQGVIQNFKPYQKVTLMQSFSSENKTITQQIIPMGPVASQVAIKELGSNGGGFFNTNSAHPFENPTPLTNFLEMLEILLIPAALCYAFGLMVKDKRQGWALLIAMLLVFIPFVIFAYHAEQQGNPVLIQPGIDFSLGNIEGKETRIGIANSALWTTATTSTSNGSVNAMLDSFTPLGGLVPLWMMHLGEIIFGGDGSGLYGMVMLVIITVFISGLLVGRSPEYLGKKIEPYEMKMATLAVLVTPLVILMVTAFGSVTKAGTDSIGNPGAHGFSEILYAFTSMGTNNGSAFAGLNANTPFYNIVGGIIMLISRFWIAIPAIAIAGSLVRKKAIPRNQGTLETHTPLFIILLISVTIILGALSFLPALALGPIVEHLILWSQYGH